MKLIVRILTGSRKGREIILSADASQHHMPYLREDEAIELRLQVSSIFSFATLEVNQHSIDATDINYIEKEGVVDFIWKPKVNGYYLDSLFFNYFGVSRFNILLKDNYEAENLVSFQPIQILARLDKANKIDDMFSYLSNISNGLLNSFFSISNKQAGFDYGSLSPDLLIDRIEHTLNEINDSFSFIINNKISRLIPEYKILPISGDDELDDTSLGWLLENLSVLEPDENPDQAHIYHEGQHYRVSSIYKPVLIESTDIYENQIIHGFLECVLHEVQQILAHYEGGSDRFNEIIDDSEGYVSFFENVFKFKRLLLRNKYEKINNILKIIRSIQFSLDKYLPVSKINSSRPVVTQKVNDNYVYRSIFLSIIKWHEHRAIDWSAYDRLFSIKSAPELFEMYCYFRLLDSLGSYFNPKFSLNDSMSSISNTFMDSDGNEVKLEREPEYWVYNHPSRHRENIVNSENYTKKANSYHLRGQRGPYSNRKPDFVFQIKNPEGDIKLLVLDAKYTSKKKAFLDYLPDLTMKYVHGIHKINQGVSVVSSLSILYPGVEIGERDWTSYHHHEMSILGSCPIEPSLQSIGVELGEDRGEDNLIKLVYKLLDLSGVKREGELII